MNTGSGITQGTPAFQQGGKGGDGTKNHSGGREKAYWGRKNPSHLGISNEGEGGTGWTFTRGGTKLHTGSGRTQAAHTSPVTGEGGGGRAKVSSESRKVPESTMLCLSMSVHIAQITPADESWVSGSTKY